MQDNLIESYDHSVLHHSLLLNDTARLNCFKKALHEVVRPDHKVVDIGTGTGILAAYAASLTKNQVYAIEYFSYASTIAAKLLSKSPFDNIQIIKNSSFEVDLKTSLDILISETIGQIGPEENIVEIAYDFCIRHPNIKYLIPSNLKIYAEIVHSTEGEFYRDQIFRGYKNASFPGFDYSVVKEDIESELAKIILQKNIKNSYSLSEPILLVEYELGQTKSSSFKKRVSIPETSSPRLLHLYFTAQLSNQIILSSRFDQLNHWDHSFICIPPQKNCLNISYRAGSGIFDIQWSD